MSLPPHSIPPLPHAMSHESPPADDASADDRPGAAPDDAVRSRSAEAAPPPDPVTVRAVDALLLSSSPSEGAETVATLVTTAPEAIEGDRDTTRSNTASVTPNAGLAQVTVPADPAGGEGCTIRYLP